MAVPEMAGRLRPFPAHCGGAITGRIDHMNLWTRSRGCPGARELPAAWRVLLAQQTLIGVVRDYRRRPSRAHFSRAVGSATSMGANPAHVLDETQRRGRRVAGGNIRPRWEGGRMRVIIGKPAGECARLQTQGARRNSDKGAYPAQAGTPHPRFQMLAGSMAAKGKAAEGWSGG
ncbi:MAG TPA: hypothetical protein DEP05_00205 [Betaproteobacteria bacterium]|nr:hypothetical protein [Betaproteobacteria bacterium]